MIVAEGLLYYFDPEKVTSLMNLLVKHFHGADLLIEVANTKMVATCHRYSALKEMGLTFQWGIDDFAAIEKISPKLHFIQEYYLYNRFRYRWKYYAALHFIPWMKKSLRIIHLNIT